jgi:hypothetical protein
VDAVVFRFHSHTTRRCLRMADKWIDWSKTTQSKNYRGSGSFATFMIIGRKIHRTIVLPLLSFCELVRELSSSFGG